MKPNGQQPGRRLKPILLFCLLMLLGFLPIRAEQTDSADGSKDPDAATRQALERAREQLKQAERAADEAAEARDQSRQAMQQAAEAYEGSASQQEKLLGQLRSLSAALNAYAKAVDRLVERGMAQQPSATASAAEKDTQPEPESEPKPEPEQSAESSEPEMETPDSGQETAMADKEDSEPSGSGQMSDGDQPDASDDGEPTTVAKRSTDSSPSEMSPAEPPAEVKEGPIAPPAQVFNSLWEPEVDEKQIAMKIVGPTGGQNACANCHTLESTAWQHSIHQTSFQDRHRSDEARQILRNLDQRSMKFRNETCRECHYTSNVQRDQLRPIAGVSCESCHGPAEDWVEIHNRLAGEPDGEVLDWGSDRESEAQREARLEKSREKGMIHSGMLYAIAANCVRCHTVPNERLVNVGEHKAGSDFELVSWAQGEVRHNFLSSPGAPDDPSNAESSAERRRLLYVVGRVADLEHTLRNLVEIEEKGGAFHTAMINRARRLRNAVAEIVGSVEIPELAFALKQVPDTIGTSTTIPEQLPEALGEAGRRFTARYSGEKLGALDPLIPSEREGEPYQAQQ